MGAHEGRVADHPMGQGGPWEGAGRCATSPLLLSHLSKPSALLPPLPLYIVANWKEKNTQLNRKSLPLVFLSSRLPEELHGEGDNSTQYVGALLRSGSRRSTSTTLMEQSRESRCAPYVRENYEVLEIRHSTPYENFYSTLRSNVHHFLSTRVCRRNFPVTSLLADRS
jgi:hypothetical protein